MRWPNPHGYASPIAWPGLAFGLLLAALLALPPAGSGQGFGKWLEEKEGSLIEPYLMLQVWSTYSHGQTAFDEEANAYLPVEDRLNVLLRRGRFGMRVQPYENLKFTLALAYDLLGHDVHSAVIGGNNNGSRPIVSVWDAWLQWRIAPDNDALHLTAGYFRPQISRESITSAWQVSSFEKAMSQVYVRVHLTGIGPGRAPGLNLGGLLPGADGEPVLNYNVGLFTPVNQVPLSNTGGRSFSPLLVGRVVYYFGDPEMDRYRIAHRINSFNERNGLALALAGSWQGANDLFDNSSSASVDLLLNQGPFHIDGEINVLWRHGTVGDGAGARPAAYAAQTGHLRAGYNLRVGEKGFLEPAVLVYGLWGPTDLSDQEAAAGMLAFSGRHRAYDLGLNWYLNRNRFRIMLHYTISQGDPGELGDGFAGNLHFNQKALGPIQRGNVLGLGLNTIF